MQAYSDEELNYFRLCKIITSVIPEGLRNIFKQQWDIHYTSTHGPWMDTPANFASFQSMESPRNRKKNKRLLGIMTNGDRKNWDSTCLSYAILFSDSVGPRLHSNVKTNVDILRESRNEVAHNAEGRLTDVDFQASVQKILIAFKTLKLHINSLLELRRLPSFPTRELNIIKKELENEKKRNAEPIPFCVLPPKSFHDLITREHEVHDISKKMKELSNRKMGETKTVYLSGNPGCGKSVLAGQIGDEYFDSDETKQPAFVMTINAATMDTLLQSYVDFATRLNCYPDSITKITTSKDLSQEKQILQLKALVAKQVNKYASWLIIIDNVINLKACCEYCPKFGEKTSGVGQILVTTQDEHCIPDNVHTQHVSLKRGMSEGDAIEVLSNVSGIREDDERMLEVAKSLDLQPLALACAGVYMKKARTCTTWQQFLEKLDQGKREATEKMFQESSLNYPMSMTLAVQMALERETSGSKVMFHAFEFLSVLANDPIPMKNVVDYVMKCLPQEDEEVVESTINSSSLVMNSHDGGELLTHQVVYHCLQDHDQVKGKNVNMFNVTATFSYLLQVFDKNAVKDIVKTRDFLNHFERLSRLLPSYIVQQQSKCQSYLNEHGETFIKNLNTIGSICSVHGKFKIAKMFFQLSLSIQLPFFIKEMDNLFVGSDIVNFNDVRKRLDMSLKKARSIFKDKNVSCDQPDFTLLSCHHESLNETEKRNIAETLSSLGIALSNLGEFSEARDCHKVALEICELEFSNLGEIYESRDCHKVALEICELEYVFSLLWLKLKAAILDNLVELSKEMKDENDVKRYSKESRIINEKIKKNASSSRESECFYNKGLDLNDNVYIKASSYYGLGKSLYSLAAHSEDSYSVKCLKEAITHFKKALEKYKSVYHDRNHPKVAHTLNQLGRCAFRLEKYDEAKSYHEDALSIYRSVYTEDHPMVGSTLSNLGKTLFALKNYKEAATCFNKSLVINESFREGHHPAVGELQRNLGLSLRKQGLFLEAKIHFKKAMDIFKIVYGKTDPMVFQILLDIAEVLRDLHEYTEARMCYEDALAIGNSNDYPCIILYLGDSCCQKEMYSEALRCYEIALAAGDHLLYHSLFKISTAFHVQRQLHKSKSLYNKALTTGYKDCPLVVKEIFNLGTTLRRHGKLNEAKSWYDEALATGYGKDCPSVGEEMFHLGTLLRHQGQLNEAKSWYDKALATGYGKDCPLPGRSIFELGTALCRQGQLDAAKSCYENVLTTGYGKDCPSVVEEIFKLGTALRHRRQPHEAKSLYNKALTTGYGKNCPSVGEEIFKLGTSLHHQGELDKAKSCYDSALTTGYGKDCPSVGEEIFTLGTALRHRDWLSKAKSCYDSALTTGYGKDCPSVGEEIFKLGTLLQHKGKLKETKSCYDNARTTGYGKDCPSVGEEFFKLGTVLRHQGLLNEAKSCYDNVLTTGYGKDCPSVGEVIFNLGNNFFQLGQFNDAQDCYIKSLSTGYAKDCTSICKHVISLFDLGLFTEAKTCFEDFENAKCIDGHSLGTEKFNLGKAKYEEGDYVEAKTAFEQCLATGYGCKHPEIFVSLGDALYHLARYDEAEICYKTVLAAGYTSEDCPTLDTSFFNLGKAFYELGEYHKAQSCYKSVLAAGCNGEDLPSFCTSVVDLGERFCNLMQYNEARICFESVLKVFRALNENDDRICLTLLKLLFTLESLKCYEEAVPYYKELLSNAKILYGRNNPIVADLYILLGETLEKLERHDEARKCSKKGKAILSLSGRIRRLLSSEQPHSTLNDIEKGTMLLQAMRTSVQLTDDSDEVYDYADHTMRTIVLSTDDSDEIYSEVQRTL